MRERLRRRETEKQNILTNRWRKKEKKNYRIR